MIRAVLVGYSATEWKLFRQPQWMAEVRRNPGSATFPKRYFDIEESGLRKAGEDWENQGSSIESALALLTSLGAVEVVRG